MKIVSPIEPAIVCADMDRMVAFYTEIFGFTVFSDARTSPELSARFGATPAGYRIVRLDTPVGKLKLVQPGDAPDSPATPEWVMGRRGLGYITFVIADLDALLARLREFSVRLISPEPVAVRPGVRAIFTLDVEGNFIEFLQAA